MDAPRSIDTEDRASKLHLVDCPEAIQRLVRKVAEDFQETLKWPSGDEIHLQRQEEGVSDLDFNAFGHAAFEFFSADGRQYARLNLWALHDTGRFERPFSDARGVIDRTFAKIREDRRAVTVTRDEIAQQIGHSSTEPYMAEVEYVFVRSYFGYQPHQDHGWQLVVDVSRLKLPTPPIEELFLSRPTRPSHFAAIQIPASRGAFATDEKAPDTGRPPLASRLSVAARAFLLFNAQDRDFVEALNRNLRQRGVSTWYDHADQEPGERFQEIEDRAFAEASAIVCILGSPGWGPTHRVLMQRALDAGMRIIPVLSSAAPRDALEEFQGFFTTQMRIEFMRGPDEAGPLDRLVEAIGRLLRPSAINIARVISTMINGSDDERSAALTRVVANLAAFDHAAMRGRLIAELTAGYSRTSSKAALAPRDPHQIPSIRSWLLSTLAWVCDDDQEARSFLAGHVDQQFEPEPAVRFWALASLFQTGGLPRRDLGVAQQDGHLDVALLASAILAHDADGPLDRLKSALSGRTFEEIWPALRALRIVPLPDLVSDVCDALGRTLRGQPVHYDALYALAHRAIAPAAAKQLISRFGVEGLVQFAVEASNGSSQRSIREFARLLDLADPDLVRTELDKVDRASTSYDAARSLRLALGAVGATIEEQFVIAGYHSDTSGKIDDQFGQGLEVETLCSVMLAKDVTPPLSIGLFGDWGTGKTFFIDMMREAVRRIAGEASVDPSSKFHGRVAQITFNAWHYIDANLWASLVSHILEELVTTIAPQPDAAETRKQLIGQLETAKQLKDDAKKEQDRAIEAKNALLATIDSLATARANKEVALADLRGSDLWSLLKDDPTLKPEIEDALKSLGLPAVRSGIGDLDRVVGDARSVAGRARALYLSVRASTNKGALMALSAIALVGAPLIIWLLKKFLFPGSSWTATVSGLATEAGAFFDHSGLAPERPTQKGRRISGLLGGGARQGTRHDREEANGTKLERGRAGRRAQHDQGEGTERDASARGGDDDHPATASQDLGARRGPQSGQVPARALPG
jgi:hypothetical protein